MTEPSPLHSPDHLLLAHHLKSLALETVTDETVKKALEKTIDAAWGGKPADEQTLQAVQTFGGEQQKLFLEYYARLGHLYEIAGLSARDHYFATLDGNIPGGVRDFLTKQNGVSLDSTIQQLNAPVLEVIMTQHPTNTNSLESIRAQRKIALAIESGDEAKVREAIGDYCDLGKTPLLHRDSNTKKDINFTVRDETDIVLNALKNLYDDLPRVYAAFDAGLKNKFGDAYTPTHKHALNLGIRMGSWGSSGDKDGNTSVSAETTLEAIILHKAAILEKYIHSLKQVKDKNTEEAVRVFVNEFEGVQKNLEALLKPFETARLQNTHNKGFEGKTLLPAGAYDDILGKAVALSAILESRKTAFREMLEQQALIAPGDDQQEMLALLRRQRVFGFGFGKIEYRETAEEYSRVVDMLVPGYKEKSDTGKVDALEALLKDPEKIAELAADPRIRAGAEKLYSKTDAAPIAYHTFRRMELAREFPDMIHDNVLAECQGTHNLLEAKFVQLLAAKDGKKPLLGIVPLFEEPETMGKVADIMKAAYESAAYKTHLSEVAAVRGKKLTQQVQIAHSDNARRTGLMGARGYIHGAHKALRRLHERGGYGHIGLQFFEGGSISDAYRNGVRAISHMVDDFGLHGFAKFTFQGGDLVNYFNHPGSIVRLYTRNLTHGAAGKVDTLPSANGNESGEHPEDKKFIKNEMIDDIAIAALKRLREDYESNDFSLSHKKMGVLLDLLGYASEMLAGNVGSRAPQRDANGAGGLVFTQVEGNQMGVAIQPVPVDNVRTIGFSEAFQHGGIVPSWIGGGKFAEYLRDAYGMALNAAEEQKPGSNAGYAPAEIEQCKRVLNGLENLRDGKALPKDIAEMFYRHSAAFRDAVDRTAYAISLTDPEAFARIQTQLDAFKPEQGQQKSCKTWGTDYVARLKGTYEAVANMAWSAIPSHAKETVGAVAGALTEWRDKVTGALGSLAGQLRIKDSYRGVLVGVKAALIESKTNEALKLANTGNTAKAAAVLRGDDEYLHLRKLLHNAGDTVVHGRMLTADDPAYGKSAQAAEPQFAMAV